MPYSINMHVVERECGLKCIEEWDRNVKIHHEVRVLYGFAVMILQVNFMLISKTQPISLVCRPVVIYRVQLFKNLSLFASSVQTK